MFGKLHENHVSVEGWTGCTSVNIISHLNILSVGLSLHVQLYWYRIYLTITTPPQLSISLRLDNIYSDFFHVLFQLLFSSTYAVASKPVLKLPFIVFSNWVMAAFVFIIVYQKRKILLCTFPSCINTVLEMFLSIVNRLFTTE